MAARRIALVTGAARGIGKATAEGLLSDGLTVIAFDLAPLRSLTKTAALECASDKISGECGTAGADRYPDQRQAHGSDGGLVLT